MSKTHSFEDGALKVWLRGVRFRAQLMLGTFRSPEPEFEIVEQLVGEGDWVIDVGANVGHYSHRFSQVVGASGRVLAFEPVPQTFQLLVENIAAFGLRNVTPLNLAASDSTRIQHFVVPMTAGKRNFYQAHTVEEAMPNSVALVSICVDALELPHRVALVKIDAEGHEGAVLRGMRKLLERDRPTLIVEAGAREESLMIEQLGYSKRTLPGSPNVIFESRSINASKASG